MFGDTRTDPYAWLRDRNDPDTIKYLEAENAYTKAMMKSTEELQAKLYAEMLGRIKQTDLSVPVKREEYFYYTRTEEGKQYAIYCRKKGSLEAAGGNSAGRKRPGRRPEIFPHRQLRREPESPAAGLLGRFRGRRDVHHPRDGSRNARPAGR